MWLAGLFWFGEQLGHSDAQGAGDALDVADRDVALGALYRADVVGMQPGTLRKGLLRQVFFQANALHVAGEERLGTELLGLIPHGGSVDERDCRIHTLWV